MFIAVLFTITKKAEVTQEPIIRQMDKQIAVQTCNGILFSIKREENADTWYSKDEALGLCGVK